MADIITFPGSKAVNDNMGKEEKLAKLKLYRPKTSLECLNLYKEFLQKDDYEEVLCCILDKDYYDKAEYQTKDLVDSYFGFKY